MARPCFGRRSTAPRAERTRPGLPAAALSGCDPARYCRFPAAVPRRPRWAERGGSAPPRRETGRLTEALARPSSRRLRLQARAAGAISRCRCRCHGRAESVRQRPEARLPDGSRKTRSPVYSREAVSPPFPLLWVRACRGPHDAPRGAPNDMDRRPERVFTAAAPLSNCRSVDRRAGSSPRRRGYAGGSWPDHETDLPSPWPGGGNLGAAVASPHRACRLAAAYAVSAAPSVNCSRASRA